jgi:hypothetical protein
MGGALRSVTLADLATLSSPNPAKRRNASNRDIFCIKSLQMFHIVAFFVSCTDISYNDMRRDPEA